MGLYFSGVYALGSSELSAYAAFTPLSTVDGPEYNNLGFPTVRFLSGTFRTLVGPELAFGAQLAWAFVGSEFQRFFPSISISKKAHLSDRAAILAGGGVEYESGAFSIPGANFNSPFEFRRIGVFGSIAVEAGVTEHVSLLLATSVEQHGHLDDVPMDYLTSFRTYASRFALLFAVSEAFDVNVGFNVSSTGAADTKTFSLSFTWRRLP